jgi:hypothetical protein
MTEPISAMGVGAEHLPVQAPWPLSQPLVVETTAHSHSLPLPAMLPLDATPLSAESQPTSYESPGQFGVSVAAVPVPSANAQVQVAPDDGHASSLPLWRVWHSRRWNHFQNAYLEVDNLSEDVGIMVSLPLALLFRLPPEPGTMPLTGSQVVLRVFLQLLIELLTELAPVITVVLCRW